ncbi:MAG: hypothetical protein Q9217_003186 [Psora testacea]
MSLLKLLKDAYSAQKNYQDKNFISYKAARRIVTKDRIDEWSRTHPLCLEHGHKCPQRIDLIHEILRTNVFVFVVLVFAELEFLIKKFIASNSRDVMLFDTGFFERVCDSAGLSAEQKQGLVKCRSYVGVIFANDASQDVPREAVLPFLKRESLDKYGSYGVLYRAFIAEKRIRPMSDPSQGDWERLFREVQTLQKRRNHPNIVPLLASYTLDTVESGHHVKVLYLLFPLAEMDLADWMTKSQIPFNVAKLSKQERQAYLYRSIYALVSSISYLHRELDGIVTAHHDLKPRNILVVNDKLKIADFGHSHLRPIIEGSATEGASGLGTYEYQPPEYWNQDGSRAQVKHGRAFDVWAMGCIIIELATLVVHDWQSGMVTEFRNERKKNPNRDRKSPGSVQDGSDISFHNNLIIVEDWVGRLKDCGGSQQLNEVLNITAGMLAPKPKNRPYMWEIQTDLYETLKPYDKFIPDLERDLCVRPPFGDGPRARYSRGMSYNPQPEFQEYTETPLHRAAKKNNRTRTIRLWELGWPLSLPDPNGETPRDIMKRSDNIELRKLENDVILMLEAARTGNTGEIRKLFSRGLSPLMVNTDGRSALYEAIISFQIDVIDCLLESKAKEQLMLWDKAKLELPLHTAARIGFVRALERVLKDYPDVNVSGDGYSTALYYAARGCHSDVVRLLLKNKAQVLPPKLRDSISVDTPLHAALQCADRTEVFDIVELLLEADDGHECLEHKGDWGMTPLFLAANNGNARYFEILLEHGASVHSVMHGGMNLLHIIAINGRHDLLRQCIKDFSLEELEGCDYGPSPLKRAQESGHKEVARLLKSYIRQASRSGGSNSGLLALFRNGLEKLKGP